jgi:hypothetical protein
MSWKDNIAAHVRHAWSSRNEPESMRLLAGAFWEFSLLGAVFLVTGFALFGGLMFFAAFSPDDEPALVSGGGGVMLNRVELKAILQEFESRAERYESIKTGRTSLTDPSK